MTKSIKATTASVRLDEGRLFVRGRRRTILGGEIHNSNSSSLEAIDQSFRRIKELGADCVLAPVSWEQLEPAEACFDFTLVDGMLDAASDVGPDLIPLWFGSWKNGMSSYAPSWVKTDPERFRRAEVEDGSVEVLSPFTPSNWHADAHAFATLMRRLRKLDTHGRVLLVQVENEVGLLGGARDLSPSAVTAWKGAVPPDVLDAVRAAPGTRAHDAWLAAGRCRHGTWAEVFGDTPAGAEAFMAAAYARYVDRVATAGRAELDVPLFVNAWQDAELDADSAEAPDPGTTAMAGGDGPGCYPSGGPVRDVISIWHACAPSIDLCAPDIYAKEFSEVARSYRDRSGALFIPEMQRGPKAVAQMFHAIGSLGAIGVSPFGADSFDDEFEARLLRDAYDLLRAVGAALAERPCAVTSGVTLTAESPRAAVTIGGVGLTITHTSDLIATASSIPAYAVLVEEGEGRILMASRGCVVAAEAFDAHPAGILSATELRYREAGWMTVRRLNGDETASGTAIRFPALDARPASGPIPVWNESTGIVRAEYYRRAKPAPGGR